MNIIIFGAFSITALLYAMVGFGGGSTYTALLVLSGVDYTILPLISLACNLVVVTGGTLRFAKADHIRFDRLWPFLASSVPAAWLGGRMPISETTFTTILGLALLVSGMQLLAQRTEIRSGRADVDIGHALMIGGALGFLAGIVGIGGGIFLAPILYRLRWGTAHEIAAAASLYIFLNSLSGMLGQVTKLASSSALEEVHQYWPLLVAVLIGGQIGSWIGLSKLSPAPVRILTGLLIVYVAVRLLWQSIFS